MNNTQLAAVLGLEIIGYKPRTALHGACGLAGGLEPIWQLACLGLVGTEHELLAALAARRSTKD